MLWDFHVLVYGHSNCSIHLMYVQRRPVLKPRQTHGQASGSARTGVFSADFDSRSSPSHVLHLPTCSGVLNPSSFCLELDLTVAHAVSQRDLIASCQATSDTTGIYSCSPVRVVSNLRLTRSVSLMRIVKPTCCSHWEPAMWAISRLSASYGLQYQSSCARRKATGL